MKRIGRYEPIRLLGAGGQGQVHEAVLRGPGGFRKSVALKVLHGGDGLRREARIGGMLRHPNLVDVYEVGEQDGTWFCAMELCAGGALTRHLPLPPRAVVEVGLQVCAALQYAHDELGLVHLDLKPDNLLLHGTTVKVADLGIARATGFEAQTRFRGTRGYMAPEQIRGEPVDARTDIYTLGRVLQALATGTTARDAPTFDASQLDDPEPSIYAEAWLEPLVDRMLEHDPERRPRSMAEVAAALLELRVEGPGLADVLGAGSSLIPMATRQGTNIGPDADRFVGRTRELALLAGALDRPGLVLIRGPGGIGKTRLARRAALAHRERTGAQAWFCDLSDARGPDAVLQALATTLAVPIDRGSRDAWIRQLAHALEGRGAPVVVLDTCEAVGDGAVVVGRLLELAPNTRFLATSREPLRLGETPVALDPLDPADAVDLLAARALDRGHDVADDPALRAIARDLDGLPFALELAASRIGVLSPGEVHDNLSLGWLRSGAAGVPERETTLASMLEWSWRLLAPHEQHALAQLSVFRGGFEPDAAEAVVSLPDAPFVLDLIRELADRSWLGWRDGRLRMLEPARTFAALHLPDPTQALQRHGLHFARAGTDDALRALDGPDGGPLRLGLAAELGNLIAATEAAVEHRWPEIAVAACRAAWVVLFSNGPISMGAELAEAALDLDGLTPLEEGHLAHIAARATVTIGDLERAEVFFQRALQRFREAGTPVLEGDVLTNLASKVVNEGRGADAEPMFAHARAVLGRGADSEALGRFEGAMALMHRQLGRMEEARVHFEAALAHHRRSQNRRSEAIVLANLGNLEFSLGRIDAAEACMIEALASHREVGSIRSVGVALGNLGTLYQLRDQLELAEANHREAIRIHRETGYRKFEGLARGNLAVVRLARGDHVEARREAEAALAIHRATRHQHWEALALTVLAYVDAEEGRFDSALEQVSAAEAIAREVGDPVEICKLVCARGTVEARAGDLEAARQRAAEATRRLDELGIAPGSDLHRTLNDLEALIAELGG